MLEIPSAPLTVASVPLLCNQATRLSIIGDTAATALLLRVSISFTTVGSPAVVSAAFGQPPHAIGITVAVRIPPNQLPPGRHLSTRLTHPGLRFLEWCRHRHSRRGGHG